MMISLMRKFGSLFWGKIDGLKKASERVSCYPASLRQLKVAFLDPHATLKVVAQLDPVHGFSSGIYESKNMFIGFTDVFNGAYLFLAKSSHTVFQSNSLLKNAPP